MKNYLVLFLTLTLIACGPPDNKPTVKEEFHPNGEMKNRTNFQPKSEGGGKHGLREEYFKTGEISGRGHYKNGKRHGLQEQYFKNGQLFVEKPYEFGKPHGLEKRWVQNGQLMSESCYSNGEKVGMNNCKG